MFKRNKLSLLIILSLVFTLLSGCGIYGPEETSKDIDPPPALDAKDSTGTVDVTTEENGDATTADQKQQVKFTIYFFDEKRDVVPYTMDIPKVEGIGQEVLKYMTVGGPAEGKIPQGFKAVLPKGTKSSMTVKADQKLAIVDFSKEFLSYEAKSAADEKKILDAITWTLTEFPTIDKVEIRVNGYPLESMPTWKTPIVGPLSRADGINMELGNNIKIGQTTTVTLYFYRSMGDKQYLVPVTRMVPETNDLAKATLEQLVIGPKAGTGLTSPILPSTKILDVKVERQMVIANFDNQILGPNKEVSKEELDILVWSLTENTGAKSVQIKVNGKTDTLTDNLAKPIMRPEKINTSIL
ncbi:GerMN domain-containing protein [Tepidibacillus fermentans]|uniref:Germination protein M n=1 Tax=Tepidibacillus fermentans TaxID=1281767 RepID=A0A4R3KJ53_9BACI|nr:GerMN domain-containing protein [Tepidibacillus fermentans]TCS83489.1 germination protein M [Tepidibacillus fermentans]